MVKLRKELRYAGNKGSRDYLFMIAIFALIIILLVSIYYSISKLPVEYVETTPSFVSMEGSTLVALKLPAVDSEGNGVIATLTVEAMPGSGRVLLDIDDLLFWTDTEQSIRKSRIVAGNVSGIDVGEYDIIYSIGANASVIGGESAGAGLAIATIAALENKSIRDDVMITGTVNHDGSIGPVLGILAKAKVSKDAGAVMLLVPLLQSRDVTYETKEHCEKFGWTEVCTTEQIPTKVKVGEAAGISVEEVETIEDALDYFIE